MADSEIIEALGGSRVVAKALRMKQSRVSNWKKRGIAQEHRAAIARLARRKKLDLTEAFA